LRFRIAAGQQKKLAIASFFGRQHQHRVRFVDTGEKKEIRALPKPVAVFVPLGKDDCDAFADLFHQRVPPRSIHRWLFRLTRLNERWQWRVGRWVGLGSRRAGPHGPNVAALDFLFDSKTGDGLTLPRVIRRSPHPLHRLPVASALASICLRSQTPVRSNTKTIGLSAGPSESLDMLNNCWAFAF